MFWGERQMRDRGSIIEQLKRKLRHAKRDKVVDAVAPITLRRVFADGSEFKTFAIGTGFLLKSYSGSGWFLVTNYHNISGRDLSRKERGKFIPNVVDILVRTLQPTEEGDVRLRGQCALRYRLVDENENPLYFDLLDDEEDVFRADIAILPISIPTSHPDGAGFEVCADRRAFWQLNRNADTFVGEDCYIVGYPRGLRGDNRYPIWKRASIASEPSNTYQGKLAFLVDTATREGMSGSPVIARKLRDINQASLESSSNLEEHFDDYLIGVYSGREGADELGVQLGIVWHSEAVEILIAKIGTSYVAEHETFIP
jgi:hypothetical protein